jgi:hypothetical protein
MFRRTKAAEITEIAALSRHELLHRALRTQVEEIVSIAKIPRAQSRCLSRTCPGHIRAALIVTRLEDWRETPYCFLKSSSDFVDPPPGRLSRTVCPSLSTQIASFYQGTCSRSSRLICNASGRSDSAACMCCGSRGVNSLSMSGQVHPKRWDHCARPHVVATSISGGCSDCVRHELYSLITGKPSQIYCPSRLQGHDRQGTGTSKPLLRAEFVDFLVTLSVPQILMAKSGSDYVAVLTDGITTGRVPFAHATFTALFGPVQPVVPMRVESDARCWQEYSHDKRSTQL